MMHPETLFDEDKLDKRGQQPIAAETNMTETRCHAQYYAQCHARDRLMAEGCALP
jgi:hypothetical protein